MRLSFEDTLDYLLNLSESQAGGLRLDSEKHMARWEDEGGERELALPLIFPRIGEMDSEDYLASIPEVPPAYVVVLIRSGSSSLGFYLSGELEAHKVIRKYMVRMKQGRSQLSYLKTKGKSRAGSRVRLRESMELFEETNAKLTEWFQEFGEPELIFHSCPVQLWSHWFESDVAPPFAKDDSRLIHIPHHVHQPDHDELLRVHRLIATAVAT